MHLPSFSLQRIEKVIISALCLAVFLVPLWVLPFTTDAFDFNKQMLLVVLVLVSLFAWMARSFNTGKVAIPVNPVGTAIGIFCVAALLSTVFSKNPYGSFWGWPLLTPESFLTIAVLALFWFIVATMFSKENTASAVFWLVMSGTIVQLLALVLGLFPQIGFGLINTIGSIGGVGMFAAVLMPLTIVTLIFSQGWRKWVCIISLLCSLLLFLFINFFAVWCVVAIVAVVLMVLGMIKKDLFDVRWLALPIFFLVVSLFFLIVAPQISWFPRLGDEVTLSQKTSLAIAGEVLQKTPLFGSGLGTFGYDYLQYRPVEISGSPIWNIVFDRGVSRIITLAATTGAVGTIAFLALLLIMMWCAARFLWRQNSLSEREGLLLVGLISAFVGVAVSYFLYRSDIVLDFVLFFLLAALSQMVFSRKKEIVLRQNGPVALGLIFVFTVLFIFGAGLLILNGQRYYAEVRYFRGLVEWQRGNAQGGIAQLEAAVGNNQKSDIYLVQLAQMYVVKLQRDLADNVLSAENKKKEVQVLGTNAINAAKLATDINPQSANNWSARGFVYQSFIGLGEDMPSWAEKSYQQALVLDPNNPYLFTQLGTLYYGQKNYDGALQQLKKAIELNKNYAPALYYSGLAHDAKGEKSLAITDFTKLLQLTPDDKQVKTILNNLKNGLSALNGIEQPAAVPPPEEPTPTP